jgi:hypothetical protein
MSAASIVILWIVSVLAAVSLFSFLLESTCPSSPSFTDRQAALQQGPRDLRQGRKLHRTFEFLLSPPRRRSTPTLGKPIAQFVDLRLRGLDANPSGRK